VLLGVLAIAAAAIPLWQKRQYVQELDVQTNEARGRAAVSENLRTVLNARVNDYNFALERKYAFPGALAVVDTVSRILPDDTWLTQFEIKTMAKGKESQRDVMLRGETANAGRLVQLFEESQMFTQAAQRGPTTKIQPGPGEIFDLGAQLKPQAPPPSITTAVSVAAPAAPSPDAAGAAAPSTAVSPAASATVPPTVTGNVPIPAPSSPLAPPTQTPAVPEGAKR
jgi:general secretion pathway protein L